MTRAQRAVLYAAGLVLGCFVACGAAHPPAPAKPGKKHSDKTVVVKHTAVRVNSATVWVQPDGGLGLNICFEANVPVEKPCLYNVDGNALIPVLNGDFREAWLNANGF